MLVMYVLWYVVYGVYKMMMEVVMLIWLLSVFVSEGVLMFEEFVVVGDVLMCVCLMWMWMMG